MERQVARELGANRTDRSGAGFMKADAILTFPTGKSLLIECKTTEALDGHGPTMRIQTRGWFQKLQQDVDAMRSIGIIAGFLVIHYLYIKEMYCLIPEEDMKIIAREIGIDMPSGEPMLTRNQAASHYVALREVEKYGSLELVTKHGKVRYAYYYIVPFTRMKGWFARYAEQLDREV
jgi:hypothetical protein